MLRVDTFFVVVSIDLLRCESIASLDPETCLRVLNKNYHMLISMTPIAKDARSVRCSQPQHIGPAIPEV